jgi:hypothetical protein
VNRLKRALIFDTSIRATRRVHARRLMFSVCASTILLYFCLINGRRSRKRFNVDAPLPRSLSVFPESHRSPLRYRKYRFFFSFLAWATPDRSFISDQRGDEVRSWSSLERYSLHASVNDIVLAANGVTVDDVRSHASGFDSA